MAANPSFVDFHERMLCFYGSPATSAGQTFTKERMMDENRGKNFDWTSASMDDRTAWLRRWFKFPQIDFVECGLDIDAIAKMSESEMEDSLCNFAQKLKKIVDQRAAIRSRD